MTDPFRELTAAYVLGALPADERFELEAHLESCARCRDDLLAFSPLPGLLGRVPLEDLEGAATPDRAAAAVVAAARSHVRRLDASRHRWRLAAGIAALVAAVLAVSMAGLAGGDDPRSGRPVDGVALPLSSELGVAGRVVADERAWGTYVHVSLTDLPPRDVYEMWAVDDAGRWHPLGSWGTTPHGGADLGCSTSLHLTDIDRLVVTSSDRQDQLAVAGSDA